MNNPILRREEKREMAPLLNDKRAIDALYRFLGLVDSASQKHLRRALQMRLGNYTKQPVMLNGEVSSVQTDRGVHKVRIPKSTPGEFRTLRVPAESLKFIQSSIRLGLASNLSVSGVAHGSVPGRSYITNARAHASNAKQHVGGGGYFYTTDVANAFPSVSSERIHSVMRAGLQSHIDHEYPWLTTEEKNSFFDLLTLLVTHDGQLPQGSPTSPHLLNAVFYQTDSQVNAEVVGPDSSLHHGVYTRYLDDIAVSAQHAVEFQEFSQGANGLLQHLSSFVTTVGDGSLDHVSDDFSALTAEVAKFLTKNFSVYDESMAQRMRAAMSLIKDELVTLRGKATEDSSCFKSLYDLIGQVDIYVGHLSNGEESPGFTLFVDGLKKIIRANGWNIHPEKDKIFLPNTSLRPEITGVLLTEKGGLTVAPQRIEEIMKVLYLALHKPDELPDNYRDENGVLDPLQLGYVINGCINAVEQVKGKIPTTMNKRYMDVKARYFPALGRAGSPWHSFGGSNSQPLI